MAGSRAFKPKIRARGACILIFQIEIKSPCQKEKLEYTNYFCYFKYLNLAIT